MTRFSQLLQWIDAIWSSVRIRLSFYDNECKCKFLSPNIFFIDLYVSLHLLGCMRNASQTTITTFFLFNFCLDIWIVSFNKQNNRSSCFYSLVVYVIIFAAVLYYIYKDACMTTGPIL